MVRDQEECVDVLHQIAAIRAALRQAALIVVRDYSQQCLRDAVRELRQEGGGDGQEHVRKLLKAVERCSRS